MFALLIVINLKNIYMYRYMFNKWCGRGLGRDLGVVRFSFFFVSSSYAWLKS